MTELARLQRIRDFWIGETARLEFPYLFAWGSAEHREWRREYRLAGMRVVRTSAAIRRHSGPAAARVGPRS
jgi:hypothetical protein